MPSTDERQPLARTPSTRSTTSRSATRSRTGPRRTRCCSSSCRRDVDRVLDLGTGDGDTLELVLDARPGATGVGLDFQDEMLDRARARFAGRRRRRDRHARPRRRRCRPISASSTSSCRASRSTTSCPTASRRSTARCSTGSGPGGVFANVEHVASHHRAAPRGVPCRDRQQPRTGRSVEQAGAGRRPSGLVGRLWVSPTRNVFGSGGNLPLLQGRSRPVNRSGGRGMSMLEFFDYLVSNDATHDLASSSPTSGPTVEFVEYLASTSRPAS